MSLAVMPFVMSGGDAADQASADAIAQDVANGVERQRYRVVSPALTAAYKGKPIDPRAVGRELNVRYLIEGELKRAGDQVIVITKIVDTTQALQAWSNRIEIDLARVTSAQVQHELAASLAYRLRGAVRDAEVRRIRADPSRAAGALELCLLGDAVWEQDASYMNGAREARRYYEQALKLDPNLMWALLSLADTLQTEIVLDPQADLERLLSQLDDVTKRAMAIDNQDAAVWMFRARALAFQGRWDSAVEAYRRAEEIDPSRLFPVVLHASMLLARGQPTAAIELADKAIRKDPIHGRATIVALRVRCEGYLVQDRVEEAIAACNKSLAGWDIWSTHLLLVSAYGRSGNLEAASSHRAALLKQWPGISVAAYEGWLRRFSTERAYLDQRERAIIPGLRRAGVPEK
jgi:adenylate cyclase